MSAKLKLHVGNKVYESLRTHQTAITPEKLKTLIQVGTQENGNFTNMHISLDHLQRQLGISNSNDILAMKPDGIISKIYLGNDRANRKITFDILPKIFIKDVLENIIIPDILPERKQIIVEYSSPNIAKPFHMGHLRSTIIGNFVANLNHYLGHKVVRLNYIGDWGTQFGFLKLGVDMKKITTEQISKDPLSVLYDAYVQAHKLGETDASIRNKAREVFREMETGKTPELDNWLHYKKYTIDELDSVYKRLGITFDEYNFESMYSANEIKDVLKELETRHLIHTQTDGSRTAVIKDKKVPIVKSDGCTLYLTRDIAAALHRYKKYKFDQMLYVVDNSQSEHFNSLHEVLFQLDLPWAGRIKHVKFGRIRGMSTRKGTAVFLKDILDEAKTIMQKKQASSPTTKVSLSDETTSDILGISCVIVNDLKQRRQKDYDFNWDKILESQGDTGVRLQYTYARLCSLLENSQFRASEECNPDMLEEPEVMKLVIHLAQFNEIILKCYHELESNALVIYLFRLCNNINKALSELNVKDQNANKGEQRLLLFQVSKEILKQGMIILGLQPLQKM